MTKANTVNLMAQNVMSWNAQHNDWRYCQTHSFKIQIKLIGCAATFWLNARPQHTETPYRNTNIWREKGCMRQCTRKVTIRSSSHASCEHINKVIATTMSIANNQQHKYRAWDCWHRNSKSHGVVTSMVYRKHALSTQRKLCSGWLWTFIGLRHRRHARCTLFIVI